MDLEGRVALVTGGARRIGRAIAEMLAQAGCHLAVHYHMSRDDATCLVESCRQRGVKAAAFQADLVDARAAVEMVRQVCEHFGRLDVLVNNAAVFEPTPIDEFDLETWQRTLAINLTASVVLAHAARDALRRTHGRIVNLGDASAERPWPDYLAYCVSKAGLHALTRALARALAPEVTVNAVAPGIAAWPESTDEETRRRRLRRVPLQRAGTPQDVAAVVKFLLTDGDYMTGVVLPLDGGRSIV